MKGGNGRKEEKTAALFENAEVSGEAEGRQGK